MPSKKNTVKILMDSGLRLKYKIKGVEGSDIFMKVNVGTDPLLKNYFQREHVALDILKKLAVPKRVVFSKDKVKKIVKQEKFAHIEMEWVPYRDCWARKFSSAQAVGVWAFVLEQLCAFHRHQILYTDIKASHFLISEDFKDGKIIDLDGCLMVERQGQYPVDFLQITAEFCGPELMFSKKLGERLLVYEMGMLLANLLVKWVKNKDLNSKTLGKMKERLVKNNLKPVWDLLEKCLSKNPSERPRDLEDLFLKFSKIKLSPTAYKIWNQLRTQYQDELTRLGFKNPLEFSYVSKKQAA